MTKNSSITPEEKAVPGSLAAGEFGHTPGVIRRTLFIMSGKGGVGKSAVAVNVAAALASHGYRTGILDADIHGPSVPNLLGIENSKVISEDGTRLKPIERGKNLSVLSIDSLLEDRDTALIWRGPKKTAAIKQFVSGADWGTLDFLVVDSPPGTGDEHLAILNALPEARAVMVTTPQKVALADVRKAVRFLEKMHTPLLGLVENMSGLVCPHCGGCIDLFTKGGGETLTREWGLHFLGAIPLDPAMVLAGQQGEPLVLLEGNFPAKDAFWRLTEAIESRLGLGKKL